ncbi:MAG: bifunctional diaminohydroxyphosphoribosylaminopyrimidine deaminase/5-amino-6-(5-phosphoribosylamino)uracil reductase RibD [Hyphomonadaceae bacterium]
MSDEAFMRRALALAAQMAGRTGPNPAVGCVIVKDGAVAGEGATAVGGRPHAEEQALAQAGGKARGAVAYITVEPCAQRSSGAASCSDLLAQAGLARVVYGASDPHPLAKGVGPARLKSAGIAVEGGLLEVEARAQNPDFFGQFS